MHIFSHLLIYWYNLLSLSLWLYNLSVILFKWSKVKDYFQMLLLWVIFIQTLYFKVLSFGVLDFILVLLIVYIFILCWTYQCLLILKLFLGCNWKLYVGLSKPDIRICSPRRLVEECGKGTSWVFVLVPFNWLLFFIYYLLQVICTSIIFCCCWIFYCIHYISVYWSWNVFWKVILRVPVL